MSVLPGEQPHSQTALGQKEPWRQREHREGWFSSPRWQKPLSHPKRKTKKTPPFFGRDLPNPMTFMWSWIKPLAPRRDGQIPLVFSADFLMELNALKSLLLISWVCWYFFILDYTWDGKRDGGRNMDFVRHTQVSPVIVGCKKNQGNKGIGWPFFTRDLFPSDADFFGDN